MKLINVIAATAIILTTSFVGVASANTGTGTSSLQSEVNKAVRDRGVRISVDQGVVTLFGNVATQSQKDSAKAAALRSDGVERVINLINISRDG